MGGWVLKQQDRVIDSFLEECSLGMQAELIYRLLKLSKDGKTMDRPGTAYLRDGIYEVRGKDKKLQARLLFFKEPPNAFCFVRAFFKNRSKQDREIDMAIKQMKAIKGNMGVDINDINYEN